MKTTSNENDIRNGLKLIWQGIKLIIKRILHVIDRVIRAKPYLFMIIEFAVMLIVSLVYIGQARAERDTANKRYVDIQTKVDSLVITSEMWHNMAKKK